MSKRIDPQSSNADSAADSAEETAAHDDSIIGRALLGSLAVFVSIGLLVGGVVWWLRREPPKPIVKVADVAAATVRDTKSIEVPEAKFTDITFAGTPLNG